MDLNTVIDALSRFDYDYVLTDEEIEAVGEAVQELEAIRDGDYIPKYKFDKLVKTDARIRAILKEWSGSRHPELTKVEYFDKIVELMNEKGK